MRVPVTAMHCGRDMACSYLDADRYFHMRLCFALPLWQHCSYRCTRFLSRTPNRVLPVSSWIGMCAITAEGVKRGLRRHPRALTSQRTPKKLLKVCRRLRTSHDIHNSENILNAARCRKGRMLRHRTLLRADSLHWLKALLHYLSVHAAVFERGLQDSLCDPTNST